MGLPQGTGTILIADDDSEVRDLTGRILKLAGYTPIEAADGKSAVEALAEHGETRLVLLDVRMPQSGNCGMTVKGLREIRPDIPILVMTGFPESEIKPDLAGVEVTGLLEKPFQPPELIQRIRTILGED